MQLYQQYAATKRAALDYDIDGLVIRATLCARRRCSASSADRPRAAVAFKFASQTKVTQAQPHRLGHRASGRVTPIAEFEPVEHRRSAPCERASLHNISNVKALGIGVGDEVLVSRRNDVIPYVEEVVVKHGPPVVIPDRPAACARASW